jgi:ATP-binding cassette subfamily C protein
MFAVGMLSTVAIMGLAAVLVTFGMFSIGIVYAVSSIIGQITSNISVIPEVVINFKSAQPIIDGFYKILGTAEDPEAGESLPCEPMQINIKGMSFAYDQTNEDDNADGDGATQIFDGLDLRIKEGQKHAIVGVSGTGKSTLLSILSGYYDDYEGSVSYGKLELRAISKSSLCKCVGVVSQNTFLFDDTMRNNITLYSNEYTDDEVKKACADAGLGEFIESLQEGLDTEISEAGGNISGGEKQRVALARVLLRKQPIMLLDEFTASLDPSTAYSMEEHVLSLTGITVVSVTHRLSPALLKHYDEIIVLDKGKVAEQGGFEELVEADGQFSSMLKLYA